MRIKSLASYRSRWIALPLALLVAMVMGSGLAFAGSLSVDDQAQILTSADRTNLQNAASRIGPNVVVVTATQYNTSNRDQFLSLLRSRRSNDNTIVVGLSTGGLTEIDAGKNTGISANEASTASSAGSSYFKNKQWGQGLQAVIASAGSLSSLGAPSSSGGSVTTPATRDSGSPFGGLFGLLIIVAIIGAVIFFVTRGRRNRAMQQGYNNPGPNYVAGPGPNYGGQNYGPGYGGPGYGPGYNNGGGSGLGAGLGGAALGGLVGYELGKNTGNHNPGDQAGGAVWGNDASGGGGDQAGGVSWGNDSGGGSGSGGGDSWGGGTDNSSGGSFDMGGGGGDSGGSSGGDSW